MHPSLLASVLPLSNIFTILLHLCIRNIKWALIDRSREQILRRYLSNTALPNVTRCSDSKTRDKQNQAFYFILDQPHRNLGCLALGIRQGLEHHIVLLRCHDGHYIHVCASRYRLRFHRHHARVSLPFTASLSRLSFPSTSTITTPCAKAMSRYEVASPSLVSI